MSDFTCAIANFSDDLGPFDLYVQNAYGGIPNALMFYSIIAVAPVLLFLMMTKCAFDATFDEDNRRVAGFFSFPEEYSERISRNQTFWAFLAEPFSVNKKKILDVCGPDAAAYLEFVQWLLIILVVVVLGSLGFILPVNLTGGHYTRELSDFATSTIANIDQTSNVLWLHLTAPFLQFIVIIIAMVRYSSTLKKLVQAERVNLTLMVENVPMANKQDFFDYFNEVVPGDVERIYFTYDVREVTRLVEKLEKTRKAIEYTNRHRCTKMFCSRGCFCYTTRSTRIDAREHYLKEAARLERKIEKAKSLAIPSGVIFVSFKTLASSCKVHNAFRKSFFTRSTPPPKPSDKLSPEHWRVSFAPPPQDIHWSNLCMPKSWLNMQTIGVNLAVLCLVLLLSTPSHLADHLDKLLTMAKLPSGFLKPLLVLLCTIALPALVSISSTFLGFYTISEERANIMVKTFLYLMFMVVFMPTFGFDTGIKAIEFFFSSTEGEQSKRWHCFFLADTVSYYIRYVISAAIGGLSFELIQLPRMLKYLEHLCCARSKADLSAIREAVHDEFAFGESYAAVILLFTMTIMFSVICPLIAPFGLLFMIFRLLVDRYMFLNYYKKVEPTNPKVHVMAVRMAAMAPIFHMAVISLFVDDVLRKTYTMVLLVIMIMVIVYSFVKEYFESCSPVKEMNTEEAIAEVMRGYDYGESERKLN